LRSSARESRSASALLALFAATACGAPERTPERPPQPQPVAVLVPAELDLPEALRLEASEPEAAEPNRDLHGPADVDGYIARLESADRLAELRPGIVIEILALEPDANVADIGCGPGVFALRFARACPDGLVYAADVEPRQLDRLREHLRETGIENVVPVLASYATPHLPPGRIDLIFIGDTLHHFEERIAYVRGLRRFLAPGGRIAIFEYKPGPLPVGPPPDHKLEHGQLAAEMREAGYVLQADHASHEYHDFQVWVPRAD
jgi:SAM-dependent methyltransferase